MPLKTRVCPTFGSGIAVYEVTVGRHPDCTCPDFQKGNLCKHYLFVMLRVLRLDRADPLVWQRALMKKEVTLAY